MKRTFCGRTGKVLVTRPSWQPLPQAHTSFWAERARLCSRPKARSTTRTTAGGMTSLSTTLTRYGSETDKGQYKSPVFLQHVIVTRLAASHGDRMLRVSAGEGSQTGGPTCKVCSCARLSQSTLSRCVLPPHVDAALLAQRAAVKAAGRHTDHRPPQQRDFQHRS